MLLKKTFLLLFAAFIVFLGFAQDKKTAIVSGVVKDARTKQPLVEAVVTLSSSAFQGQKFALTDTSGTYRINNLPAGTYSITFEMEGYRKFIQENVDIKSGMSLGVSFEMVKDNQPKQKQVANQRKYRYDPNFTFEAVANQQ